MHRVEVSFDNGVVLRACINGSPEYVRSYYALGRSMNVGTEPGKRSARITKLVFLNGEPPDESELREYDAYFTRAENANQRPLEFEQWRKKVRG